MRIVLTGGGSGGHIFPLVAVARELRHQVPDVDLLYIGTRSQLGNLATETMQAENIPVKNILTGKMRRYFSLQYFVDIFRFPIGIVQALWHLLLYMPDGVFSKGGYAAVPVVIAAWIYRIPILSHDSDAVPGWANRIGGKLSTYVAISYPQSADYFVAEKVVLTGNPIRKELCQGDATRAYERWGFVPERKTIFVFGGSQGSMAINKAIINILPQLTKLAQVLHVSGPKNYDDTVALASQKGFRSGDDHYVLVPFLGRDEMADAYAIADLAIARAGANSITELAANRVVAILVPLASHDQPMNAFAIARAGGALVLEEANLGSHLFYEKIEELLRSRTLREQMKTVIADFYHPDAAQKIVTGILKMLKKEQA